MDDTLTCPICGNKLKNQHLTHFQTKTGDYVSRSCIQGTDHSIQFYTNKSTNIVEYLTLSLNPKNSRYLDIDFINEQCRIHCMKDGKPDYISIPKMIIPDFPALEKLKERVNLYVVFS